MTGWWGRQIATVACIGVVAVGCAGSSGPEPAEPLESAEPLTTPAPTGLPVTTVSPTTEPTVDSTTTSTSTSTVPPTTTEPVPPTTTLEDLRQEIEDDLNEGEQALITAGGDPAAAASRDLVRRYFAGGALERVLAALDRLAQEGTRFRSGETVSSIEVVTPPEIDSATEVRARTCRIDAAVVFRPLPDGGEEIVGDTVVRIIADSSILKQDGTWKFTGGVTLSRDESVSTCA